MGESASTIELRDGFGLVIDVSPDPASAFSKYLKTPAGITAVLHNKTAIAGLQIGQDPFASQTLGISFDKSIELGATGVDLTIKPQLAGTVEQYEASNEELKASNEELQAMNEEMRSAAEELETSKEELQSVNEELTTVNYELKSSVEDLSRNLVIGGKKESHDARFERRARGRRIASRRSLGGCARTRRDGGRTPFGIDHRLRTELGFGRHRSWWSCRG